jgi:Chitobiase/beta-hexosaminidase C-terminal domain
LIPYDIVVAFWSDGAGKSRWVAVPNEKIKYSPTGDWTFPRGTVLDPPAMSPEGGSFGGPIEISLTEREPGADIRYTLDGSVPGRSDIRYEKPFKLTGPAVVRARAFKDGFTRSITAQEVFIIGN